MHNQMIWFAVASIAIAATFFALWGPKALTFFITQSWVAFTLLELVNYLEHYGLCRKQVSPGDWIIIP